MDETGDNQQKPNQENGEGSVKPRNEISLFLTNDDSGMRLPVIVMEGNTVLFADSEPLRD